MNRILDAIHSPQDLKRFSKDELVRLAAEIRGQMITRLSITGGHVGANLGMIEATIALHYVFDSPKDKIIFDVSHQCYTHKLLTGRKAAYLDPAHYADVTGFTNPAESEHDLFCVGHSSTAVGLACGLAKARDLKGKHNRIVAVVGDGALSGGEAFEGLNYAATLGSQLLILVNDNNISIAENHGGLYENLRLLRDTDGTAPCNYFRALGLDYRFVADGHDIGALVDVFLSLRDFCRPTVVHICTVKGKGYPPAMNDREGWHQRSPFEPETGRPRHCGEVTETYENLTRDFLAAKMRENPMITAITAGTPKILGFDENLRRQFSEQFIDVGIAEEHAITLASGIAKNSGRPVFGVSSTFLQRTYDQLSHDLALNRSPAVILVFFAGISQGSQTHMGVSDLSMVRSIPNLVCLAPTCKEEYLSMLDWSLQQTEYPVVIRVPGIETVSRAVALLPQYGYPAKYEIVEHGTDVAILALGKFFGLGESVREKLAAEYGIHGTLINPRHASAVDETILDALPKYGHRLVVTLEDGVLDGGFGEMIARFYGNSAMKMLNYGAEKGFVDLMPVEKLYSRYRLTEGQIVSDILDALKQTETEKDGAIDVQKGSNILRGA